MQGQLAELFIDITLRGGGKVELVSLRDKIRAADKSLENSGDLYKRQTKAKIDQLGTLADRQKQLAAMDIKTYGSKRYLDLMMKQTQSDRVRQQAEELRLLQKTTVERGKGVAIMQLLKNRMISGNTGAIPKTAATSGPGGALLSSTAQVAGAALQVAPIVAAITAAIYTGINLARGASPVADKTYEGSWKMLTNEIGMTLVPALMGLSRDIQTMARALERFRRSPSGQASGGVASGAVESNPLTWLHRYNMWVVGLFAGAQQDAQAMLTSSQHQSQFRSFEEGWKATQQEAASGGSIEARLLQQAMEANQIARQIADNTGRPAPRPGNVP